MSRSICVYGRYSLRFMQPTCIVNKMSISSLLQQWEIVQIFHFEALGILSILEAACVTADLSRAHCALQRGRWEPSGKTKKCCVTQGRCYRIIEILNYVCAQVSGEEN